MNMPNVHQNAGKINKKEHANPGGRMFFKVYQNNPVVRSVADRN